MKPIPYGRQHITQEDIEAVTTALQSEYLTQGPKIKDFEDAFAQYVGSRYAVALANGTAALHLCALALDVNAQSNVIVPPITFAASANCIGYCEGNVTFVDIDPNTFLIDLNQLEQTLNKFPNKFKGIIPVDFAGHPVNLEELKTLADKFGLWIIEDACHAPGGYFRDSKNKEQMCGNSQFADCAIFSFHPVKHIAAGEGGMITTNDKKIYEKLLLLRTHGITKDSSLMHENHGGWYYEMQALGYNYRLTDFQAALGLSQLKRADEGLIRRKEIASTYFNAFKSKDYILNQSGVVEGHAYHLYIIEVNQRKELYNFLRENNIFCQVHYIPVHTLPYYQSLGWKLGNMPVAEKYYSQCISLPMFPTLTFTEQMYVIEKIDEFFTIQ